MLIKGNFSIGEVPKRWRIANSCSGPPTLQ
jgi:hypothetical protein